MKKKSVLWLLPLVAALFFSISFDLAALTNKEEKELGKLQSTLEKKGKLKAKDQARLDQLLAAKPAEVNIPPALGTTAPAISPIENTVVQPGTSTAPLPVGSSVADSAGVKSADDLIGRARPSENQSGATAKTSGGSGQAEDVPVWITDPPRADDYIIGIGRSKGSSDRMSIQMADARARQDIAFQLGVQVRAMITDYAKNVGIDSEYDILQASEVEMIGQQLTKVDLIGLRVEKRQKTADGTWWTMVYWPRPEANKNAAKMAAGVFGRVPPAYAEKAQEAVRLMDEQLAKAILKPTVEIEE